MTVQKTLEDVPLPQNLKLKCCINCIPRYPLGICFGLGFDTSSEVALLGISSIEATHGTSIWVILIFPVLFTGTCPMSPSSFARLPFLTQSLAGMCLIDTLDGALMLTLYILPMTATKASEVPPTDAVAPVPAPSAGTHPSSEPVCRARDPITFLYYSIVLTALTVMVALVVGVIQLLTLVLNVAAPEGPFWDGVQTAGDYYDVIGGAICGSFVVVGGASVLAYGPWRRRAERRRRQGQGQGQGQCGEGG